jgi:hypothetical protein
MLQRTVLFPSICGSPLALNAEWPTTFADRSEWRIPRCGLASMQDVGQYAPTCSRILLWNLGQVLMQYLRAEILSYVSRRSHIVSRVSFLTKRQKSAPHMRIRSAQRPSSNQRLIAVGTLANENVSIASPGADRRRGFTHTLAFSVGF